MLNNVAVGQTFSEYFSSPYVFSFHQLFHIHLSSQHPRSILVASLNNQKQNSKYCPRRSVTKVRKIEEIINLNLINGTCQSDVHFRLVIQVSQV
jgi:hypothetical protein